MAMDRRVLFSVNSPHVSPVRRTDSNPCPFSALSSFSCAPHRKGVGSILISDTMSRIAQWTVPLASSSIGLGLR